MTDEQLQDEFNKLVLMERASPAIQIYKLQPNIVRRPVKKPGIRVGFGYGAGPANMSLASTKYGMMNR